MSKTDKIIPDTKRGYLRGDYEYFHLKDQKEESFEFHHHDFDKILIFISGNVTYLVEGKAYKLKPWDIILVSSTEVHKPMIDSSVPYERIVVWVNSQFLTKHSSNECDLTTCFHLAASKNHNLLRLAPKPLLNIKQILNQIETVCLITDYGSRILKNSLIIQLAVHLNRELLGTGNLEEEYTDIEYDESIGKIISYINDNLASDLSIATLSATFFIDKHYMMHKFKKQTGYSIHNYILQKRLIMANSLIKKGIPSTEVCVECGFGDYSTFVRAFKKVFGLSPKKHYMQVLNTETTEHFLGDSY